MLIFASKLILLSTMSAPALTIHDRIPFVLLSTPADSMVGTDVFFNDPHNFDFNLPPYRITAADVAPTPGRPLLTVYPGERGLSTTPTTAQSWPPFYFLAHSAIYRLLPFVRVPVRITRTDPQYLATILDRAVPVFVSTLPHRRSRAASDHPRLCRRPSSVLMHLSRAPRRRRSC
jgi:hypothetical protein